MISGFFLLLQAFQKLGFVCMSARSDSSSQIYSLEVFTLPQSSSILDDTIEAKKNTSCQQLKFSSHLQLTYFQLLSWSFLHEKNTCLPFSTLSDLL